MDDERGDNTAAMRRPGAAVGGAPAAEESVLLDGRYRIVRKLGQGGMGAVYEALDERVGGHVAVKRIDRVLGKEPAMQERFFREVAAMVCVHDANVVRVTDRGVDSDGRPYFVMELMDGAPLSRLLAKGVGLPVERVVAIAEQLLRGVHAIHEMGFIHRDLKPPNVMVEENRLGGLVVKIVDFGIAKALDVEDGDANATKTGMVLGTPGYAAPEMYSASRAEPHPRQDLYSVGVILFEMLVGGSPWASKTAKSVMEEQGIPIHGLRVSTVRTDVPKWLDDLVACATQINFVKRYASAQEMLTKLLEGARSHVPADDAAAAVANILELAPGTRVGAYEVVNRQGSGGQGVVYAAFDPVLKRRVALKFMKPEDEADPLTRGRFEREGSAAAQIEHPNVVRAYHATHWGRHPYLVLEFIDAPKLRERWHALQWPGLRDVICQIGAALDACHAKGIVHRDVTPENILVDESGRAKLVDFGIARAEGSSLTRVSSGEVLGRYGYKPLEQAIDPQAVKAPADEWALAAVVYEALTGRPPYEEPGDEPGDHDTSYARLASGAPPRTAAELNPSVERRLSDVLARALAVQPAERFPNVGEFVTALVAAGGAPELAVRTEGVKAGKIQTTASLGVARATSWRWWLPMLVVVALAVGLEQAYTRGLLRWPATARQDSAAPPSSPVVASDAGQVGAAVADAAAPSAAAVDARPAPPRTVTLRLEGKPAAATAIVDKQHVPLPATLERPAGTVLSVVIDAPGYHHQELELKFDSSGIRTYELHAARKAAPKPGAPPASSGQDEDILVEPTGSGK